MVPARGGRERDLPTSGSCTTKGDEPRKECPRRRQTAKEIHIGNQKEKGGGSKSKRTNRRSTKIERTHGENDSLASPRHHGRGSVAHATKVARTAATSSTGLRPWVGETLRSTTSKTPSLLLETPYEAFCPPSPPPARYILEFGMLPLHVEMEGLCLACWDRETCHGLWFIPRRILP